MSVLRVLSYADEPGSRPSLLGRGPSELSLLLIHSPLGKTGVRLLAHSPGPKRTQPFRCFLSLGPDSTVAADRRFPLGQKHISPSHAAKYMSIVLFEAPDGLNYGPSEPLRYQQWFTIFNSFPLFSSAMETAQTISVGQTLTHGGAPFFCTGAWPTKGRWRFATRV